jgi:hypothetical protein
MGEIRVITDFLSSFMTPDPKDRVDLSDLRKHRWLSESKKDESKNPCICGEVGRNLHERHS